jgi:Uma2 family endonuclease
MPAGGLHGQILAYLMELLRYFLDQQGLMLLLDTFLLYRDESHTKQRVAPDLLLMPFRFPPPAAYDLDTELPPLLVVEVTSPNSHLKDLHANLAFYHSLGIRTYLAIDAVTPQAQLREPIEVYLWREKNGVMEKVKPNRQGALALPEMGVQIFTRKDHIRLVDLGTGQPLYDMEAERRIRRAAERRAQTAEQQAAEAESQAETERQARLQAEARLRELEEKLKQAGLE